MTRANSSSVASGLGTAVITNCATTTSNDWSGKRQPLGVHHRQRFDIVELVFGDALIRLAQHRLRQIDADDSVPSRIVGQRNPGADADFQNAPALRTARQLGRYDRGAPAGIEHRAEHQIVDRRPERIGALDA